MWRVIFALPGWLLQFALQIPLMLAGAVLVPIAAWRYQYRYDRNADQFHFTARWMWLWDNQEDGVAGPQWYRRQFTNPRNAVIAWSAWRNSVGNARWTRLMGLTVDPRLRVWEHYDSGNEDALKYGPYLVRQGWRYELKFTWNPKQPDWTKRRIFWIGWRIAQQKAITSGVGFACQAWASL